MTGMISRAVMYCLALTLFASVTVTTKDVPEIVHFPTANGSVKLVGWERHSGAARAGRLI